MKAFYEKLMKDELIGFIFIDIAHLDLHHHLPIIVDFWQNVLFNTGTYSRNAMAPHFNLNKLVNFEPQYFEKWLCIFNETVHTNFWGRRADLAVTRAGSIAAIMQIKINQINENKLNQKEKN